MQPSSHVVPQVTSIYRVTEKSTDVKVVVFNNNVAIVWAPRLWKHVKPALGLMGDMGSDG